MISAISFSSRAIAFFYLIFLYFLFYHGFLTKKMTALMTCCYVFVIIVNLVIPSHYVVFVLLAVQLLLIYLLIIHLKNWPFATFLIILSYTLVACTWMLAFDLPKFLLGETLFQRPVSWLDTYLLHPLIFCALLFGIHRFDARFQLFIQLKAIRKKYRLLSLVMLSAFAFSLTIRHALFLPVFVANFAANVLYTFFIMFMIAFLVFFLIQHYEYQNLNQELTSALSFEQSEQLSLHQFKHDYKDLLLTLQLLLQQKKYDEATDYLQRLTNYSEDTILTRDEETQILSLPNPQLQAQIRQLLTKLTQENIPYSFIVDANLGLWNMNSIDYFRCISILSNNAFEEAQRNKQMTANKLTIGFLTHDDHIRFEIENYTATKVELTTIFKKRSSFKANHSGLGLFNLAQIANKYNNVYYSANAEEHRFLFQLDVPKRIL